MGIKESLMLKILPVEQAKSKYLYEVLLEENTVNYENICARGIADAMAGNHNWCDIWDYDDCSVFAEVQENIIKKLTSNGYSVLRGHTSIRICWE
jgi:hypothetical protein